jgi:hypothetical protein
MRVAVNGREYEVQLRAAAWPHLMKLSRVFAGEPVSEQELEEAESAVFRICVVGEVREEDREQLLVKVLSAFTRMMAEEFRTFRP